LPTIVGETQENVYLLGIDTVDFSKRSDKQQYAIFRDLIDSLRHEDLVATEDPQDVAVLLTGDGVFVGFRKVTSRLSPLRVALRLRRMYQELRSYELRFGVNGGPATWIFFDNGGPQLISHAVNWTARVMSAAGGNQVLISDSYYQQCIRPAIDEIPEAKFDSVQGLVTKHNEPLAIWQAIG
jgi:class 3 adenylate cyclase